MMRRGTAGSAGEQSGAPYARKRALALEAQARDARAPWPDRRYAALLLERALARIDDARERRYWLRRLGAPDDLWARLARFARMHRLPDDSGDLAQFAQHECRLGLAPYLFRSGEVIARIEGELRRSDGVPDGYARGIVAEESRRALEQLQPMERAIVEHLIRRSVIRWAGLTIGGEVNALVAQPIGTVVVTIRPPGSCEEIEIKRAGRVRPMPFDLVWMRNGAIVPSAHHLDGGSTRMSAAFEADASAFFSRVFRLVHGFDADMSRVISFARIDTIPTATGEADLQRYFTTPKLFGDRYYEMRWNLYHIVRTLKSYANATLLAQDDKGLTREFIALTKPAQSIQLGTSALRLDRAERSLRPTGANDYFAALGRDHDADDDRRFADELLDELLGIYEPPRIRPRAYAAYVRSAFAVPANRARADRVYVSLMEQVARFWGTLLAIRGSSEGESFVERNVGIKSVFRDGEWHVRVTFMDHDALRCAARQSVFRPRNAVYETTVDALHILGGYYANRVRVRGELECLRVLYRVSRSVAARGMRAFRAELERAYRATHDSIRTNPSLAALFPKPAVDALRDWDELVREYLALATPSARASWPAAARARLAARGYDPGVAKEHVDVIRRESRFLRRLAFLF